MRLLSVFWSRNERTGADKRLLFLLRGLAEKGHEVTLVTKQNFQFDPGPIQVIELNEGLLPSSKLDSLWKVAMADCTIRRARRSDVIISFGLGGGVPGLYLKRRTGTKHLLALRALPVEDVVRENVITQRFYESVNAIYLSALLQEADRIVVQLENHRRKMVKKHKIDESIVNVVPNNILSPIESSVTSNRPRCLLFVGSLIRRKGVDILLKAFEHLVSDELDIQLHIAGEGPLQEKIRSYVSRQNLDSKVTLHGYVHDVRALMKRCDILVVPSRMDPFPNVVLEALSVGTPSVVTDIEELRSAFGEAVEYAPANDPYGLASTVRKMIDKGEHENLKKKTIIKRKNFVFDWVKEFELILRNMIRKNVESQA